jgi:hypothetical protein
MKQNKVMVGNVGLVSSGDDAALKKYGMEKEGIFFA